MILFADTSALVKIYLEEEGSDRMTFEANRCQLAISLLAFPEASATFARRVREGLLSRAERDALQQRMLEDGDGWVRVPVNPDVVERCPILCTNHALHGGDAVQLASALLLADHGLDVRFAASDERLLRAAREEGLSVLDPALQPESLAVHEPG